MIGAIVTGIVVALVMGEEKLKTGEMTDDEFLARALLMASDKIARAKAERDEALAAKKVAEDKINFVTMATWKGHRGVYLSGRDTGHLTSWAKIVGMERGL